MADFEVVNEEMGLVTQNQSAMIVRSAFSVAQHVQKPRVLAQVERKFVEECNMGGESFYYGWAAGNGRIEGASHRLALSLARCWGNCVVEQLPMQEANDAWIFTSAFVDLETGFTLTRQFRQSKRWKVHGSLDDPKAKGYDPERAMDIRYQIGQSKSARNVVLAALPEWLVEKGVDESKKGVRQRLEKKIAADGLAKVQETLTQEFKKHGVTLEMILAKTARAKITGLTKDDLVMLTTNLKALQTGQESVESLFDLHEGNGSTNGNGNGESEKSKSRMQQMAEVATQKEQGQPASNNEAVQSHDTDDKFFQARDTFNEWLRKFEDAGKSQAFTKVFIAEMKVSTDKVSNEHLQAANKLCMRLAKQFGIE